ncbi:MAG: hypothetical protein ACRD4Y_10635 [Candidatus Acidiferrales bacterium]
MSTNSIFGLNNGTRVRVPEIEVRGDRLRVQQGPPEQEAEERLPNSESRTYRLPKTKWF